MDRRSYRLLAVAAGTALALTAAGCGGDGETVDVTLQEFSIGTEPASTGGGEVTFDVTNDGPDDVHEFVLFRTDLGLTELPTDENGAVVEDGEGLELVDEIEDIPVGETQSLTVDLDAGSYVIVCNIWDEEEEEAHYQEGMRTSFTVE
jgi:uncharacterized cupredoxin-like copper-binding protein